MDEVGSRAHGSLQGWRACLLLALAALALYGFLTTRSTLWDRDEARFAQATVEMVASRNWLYPTFNHDLRPDKPILIYWLMSVPVRVFGAPEWTFRAGGATEWTVRSWAPIGAVLAGLATAFVGRRLLGPRTGFLAMAMLLSTPLVIAEGTAATVDAVMLACTTAAVAAFASSLRSGPRAVHLVAFTIALALAQLAKGPVGLVLPGLAVLGTTLILWWAGEPAASRSGSLGFVVAAAASLAIFALWFLPANAATGGEYFRLAVGRHIVDRVGGAMQHRGGGYLAGLPLYVPVVLVGFAPWMLYLPAGFSAVLGRRMGGPWIRALLLAWIATCFLFMTLVATKRAHYVMPMWPALALLSAATLDAAAEGRLDERDLRWIRRGAWLYATVLAALVLGLALAPLALDLPTLRPPAWIVAGVLLASGAWAIRLLGIGRHLQSAAVLFAGQWVAVLCAAILVLPALEELKAVPGFAAVVRERVAPDVPVARFGFDAASFDYYLDRPPIETLATDTELSEWARRSGPGLLVTTRTRIEASRGLLPPELLEIVVARGFDYSKVRPIELVALGRNLSAH